MPITVKLEDGSIAEFPDGSTPEFIQGEITRLASGSGDAAESQPEPTSTGLRGAMNYMAEHPATGADVGHAIGAGAEAFAGGVKGLAEGAANVYRANPTPNPVEFLGRLALASGKGLAGASMDQYAQAARQGHLDKLQGQSYGTNRGPSGRGLSATGHAIAGSIPGVGPLAAGIVERGAAGDVSGAIGELGGNVALGRAVGGAGKKAFSSRLTEAQAAKATAAKTAASDLSRQRANEALRVKPKDFARTADPTVGAMRNKIDLEQPAPAIESQISGKLDDFTAEKKTLLDTPGTAGLSKVVTDVADSLDDLITRANNAGQTTQAKRVIKNQGVLRRVVNGEPGKPVGTGVLDASGRETSQMEGAKPPLVGSELSLRDIQTLIQTVDDIMTPIRSNKTARPLFTRLSDLRKNLNEQAVAFKPELGRTNKNLQDLASAKRAVGRRIGEEKAAYPPRELSGLSVAERAQLGLDVLVPPAGAALRALRSIRRATK